MATVVFVCFLPALNNGFVWDDKHNLIENNNYRGLSRSHLYWMFTTFHDANYHPLTWLTLGFDFVLWGMNPAGYHLTNLVFHVLNTVLLYTLIILLLRRSIANGSISNAIMTQTSAAAGALFFAVHPLRVETVCWLSARGDVVCGFFYLLTIISYVNMVDKKTAAGRRRWFLLTVLFFLLSLLSRAWGITLPLVLIILDLYPLGRFAPAGRSLSSLKRLVAEKIPFAVFALGAGALAILAKKGPMLKLAEHGLAARFMQAGYGLGFYLWKTVIPIRTSSVYLLDKTFNPMALKYIIGAIFAFGITAGLIFIRHRRPWALTTWICYAVIVSPLLGLVQSGPQMVADRYTYIACLPFAVLLGAGINSFLILGYKGRLSKTVMITALNAIWIGMLVLSILSFRQTRIWNNDRTFWSYVINLDSGNYIAYNNRGVFFRDHEGDLAMALKDFSKAVALNPEFVGAYYNRGLIREQKGDFAGAVEDYTRIIRLDSENEKAFNNRGGVLKKQGKLADALTDFNTAIRLKPFSPEGYANRGVIWLARNEYQRAVEDLNKALEVAPANWVYRGQVEKILADVQERSNADD
jgi:hypothetical protein